MKPLLERYAAQAHALLRIFAGYAFALHGSQKLFGFPGEAEPAALLSQRGLAGIIELFGGVLAVLGLGTGWAAFVMSGEMAVAYLIGHVLRFGDLLFPLINRGEPAVLFCFIWLYFASRGAGIWSLDHLLLKRRLASSVPSQQTD